MTTPRIIPQGDTVSWQINLSNYPADAWTLTYTFINDVAKFTATGSDVDGTHTFTLTSADTGLLVPGSYRWTSKVAAGLEVYTVGVGDTEVTPDTSQLLTYDARTWAEISLDNVEAVIQNRATLDQESYSIAGRSLARTPLQDLINLRKYLQAEVSKEQAAITGVRSNIAKVRF